MYTDNWIKYIRTSLDGAGYSEFWVNQNVPGSCEWFKSILKLRLSDQFKQKWAQEVSQSGKCFNYRIFKVDFGFEDYLLQLSPCLRKCLTRFRCRNHRLPVESARNIDRLYRTCTLCELHETGDEFHYILKCPALAEDRRKYVKRYYYVKPSTVTFNLLLNSKGKRLVNLVIFVKIILAKFN
jgi:hypothetical protein